MKEGEKFDPMDTMTHKVTTPSGVLYMNINTGEVTDTKHPGYYRSQWRDGRWVLTTFRAYWPHKELPELNNT